MRILALQWDAVWEATTANLKLLTAALDERLSGSTRPIDLVVLPEIFHAGFSMQPAKFAEVEHGQVSQCLAGLAKRYHLHLLAGVAQQVPAPSQAKPNGQRFYNRALLFDPTGLQSAAYSKQKSFSYAQEHHTYTAGNQPQTVTINGQVFALFICYDLRFPELFRAVAKKVSGIIVIANWPASRQAHWETLLTARAIENQCFVIGVNRIGEGGNGLQYAGGSMLIDPTGTCLAYGDNKTASIEAQIDLDQVRQVRATFPFLQDLST